MPMVKRRHNAPDNICDSRLDEGQAENVAAAGVGGGLQIGADRAQENIEGTHSGLAERPAEDAVADSVTVELHVIGPTEFGDIELELPEGFYNDNDGRAVYAANEGVLNQPATGIPSR